MLTYPIVSSSDIYHLQFCRHHIQFYTYSKGQEQFLQAMCFMHMSISDTIFCINNTLFAVTVILCHWALMLMLLLSGASLYSSSLKFSLWDPNETLFFTMSAIQKWGLMSMNLPFLIHGLKSLFGLSCGKGTNTWVITSRFVSLPQNLIKYLRVNQRLSVKSPLLERKLTRIWDKKVRHHYLIKWVDEQQCKFKNLNQFCKYFGLHLCHKIVHP